MKMKEINELSAAEIVAMIKENEDSLVDLQFTHELKQLTNTAKLKHTRKDIARLKTALRARELNEANNTEKN